MQILTSSNWTDYELLDSGEGKRLERFGPVTISRPDPQAIWKPHLSPNKWHQAQAVYASTGEDGKWLVKTKLPEKWLIHYRHLSFWAKLTPFKHTGIFPEQSVHWDWLADQITSSGRKINVLNLFGYTGIAGLSAAAAGAKVTHVDSSYPTIGWARENQAASNLSDKPIRWIQDDSIKFTQRELKRGVKYNAIIMDPPAFGHGPKGQMWKFNHDFPRLLQICTQLLSETPIFVIVNAYAISASALMLENVLADFLPAGKITSGELALPETGSNRLLSTGIFARWSS